MKKSWAGFIAVGAVFICYAMFMNTTVGGMHNIGLLQERQIYMMLGCALLLAGVVLFAVFKIKQTPEQEKAEIAEGAAAIAKAKAVFDKVLPKKVNPVPPPPYTPPAGAKQVDLQGNLSDLLRRPKSGDK